MKAWGAQKNFHSPIFSAAQFFPQPNFFRSPIFFPTAKIFLGCTNFFPANIFSSPSIIVLPPPPPSHKCLPRSSLIHYSGLSTLDLKNITNLSFGARRRRRRARTIRRARRKRKCCDNMIQDTSTNQHLTLSNATCSLLSKRRTRKSRKRHAYSIRGK